ncbi:carbamoyltransferase C-terminal domain-containing protein [Streptomyces cyaneofuscatus]|uniref:carbamoyltransferase family protein n=1 Tax=Streptomyces cyaneofuscatus TaxID=66883 RepID=UPI002D771716|nr:carbamoyltransferase C-terminal domain-containing protein [Streptomyces cyaneofuscatus]WRO12381.1 carbamoyltransferase C-terminal domain-containing protein [Streptomyces cyaneofuscatus]
MIVLGYNGFGKAAELFARLYRATGIDRHLLFGHDSAAALIVDGSLVAAVEEERLNREKKTSKFPSNALNWCLESGSLTLDDVDVFAFSWQFSDDVMDRMIAEITEDASASAAEKLSRLGRLAETHAALFGREAILADFHEHTGHHLDPGKLTQVPHHLAHLMTGYHLAGGHDTAFLVSDGRAEWLSAIAGEVRGGEIRIFDELSIDSRHSLAMLFSVVTRYLGFVPNNDEYKVMALAGYAPPPQANPLLDHVVTVRPDGTYEIPYPASAVPAYYALFDRVFDGAPDRREDFAFRVRVAGAAQQMIEVLTAAHLGAVERRSDESRLVFEGGLALNCVNNTKLLEGSRFTAMDVSFGASDVGVALGAALYASREAGDTPRTGKSPYLGPEFSREDILAALDKFSQQVEWREVEPGRVPAETAALLQDESVVGWFQGRMEYGPRALGNRSILANPRFPSMKDLINERIKQREPFRPFAPVVLEELAPEVFETGKKDDSPYMTFVFPVRPAYQELIQGACHVDATARIQTVTDESNPQLAQLLRRFNELTGVPCLINTSFNVAGEPIVCSPVDALACFLNTDMDHLVLGSFLVRRTTDS